MGSLVVFGRFGGSFGRVLLFLGFWASKSSMCIRHVYVGAPYIFSIKFFITYQKNKIKGFIL